PEPEPGAGHRPPVPEVRAEHVRVREGRVEVDRHLEPRRALEDGEVARIVEIGVADVRVDVAALEAELGDAPLELVCGLERRGDGKAGKADEAGGILRDES